MSGFSMPLVLQGEAINCYASNDDEFHTLQPEKDTFRDFSTGASYPVQSNPILGRFIEGIPLSDITTVDNRDNFSASNPFDYPLECPKNIVPSHDYSNTMNYECNNLPLDTSTIRWDFSKSPISNGWILPDCGRSSNELSLSLSTSRPNGTSVQEWCLETSSSGLTNYSLHQRHIGSEQTSCNSNNISSSLGSSKPVEIPHLLLGSRYFHGMQEILAEIARFALGNLDQTSYLTAGIEDSLAISFPSGRGDCGLQDREVETKKKRLLALLQMVDDRFNQCLDEIHTVVSAFHAVTELDPSIHARFSLPTISFMYKNLRERISCHILALGTNFNEGREKEDKSFEASFIQKQWALQQLRRRDHPLWRPQRGLPERSVSVLRAWMFQNFLHPYPKDAEKHLLALKSGLTRSQVSNWFINARVRLWKPMIEEMYAEMNRRNGYRNDEGNDRSHMFFENTRFNLQ